MFLRAAAILAFLVLLAPIWSAQTSDSVRVLATSLPEPVEAPTAAVVGRYVYVFGGHMGEHRRSDDILRFDPVSGAITSMAAKLNPPRQGATAVAAGGVVYLFGGNGCFDEGSAYCATVAKYNPATDTFSNTTATFGTGYYYMAAAAAGDDIYVLGGGNTGGRFGDLLRFDVATETLIPTRESTPVGIEAMAAAAVGSKVYFFGGFDKDSRTRDFAFEYDPTTNKLTQLSAKLPRKAYGMSAATDGKYVYLFGGRDYPIELDSIVRFDPTERKFAFLTAALPSPRFRTAAAWADDAAFVFGGEVENSADPANSVRFQEIVRFEPAGDAEPTQEIPDDGGLVPAPGLAIILGALAMAALAFASRRR